MTDLEIPGEFFAPVRTDAIESLLAGYCAGERRQRTVSPALTLAGSAFNASARHSIRCQAESFGL